MTTHPIAAPALKQWASAALQAGGMRPGGADQVADVLVWADLRGTGSHGVSRLPLYLQWLQSGEMDGQAEPHIGLQLPALTLVDGQHGAGAIGMNCLTSAVAAGAQRAGACVGLLKATTHTGALGYYTSRLAEQGLLSIAMAASGPMMAYFGAAANGVSTAPISIAAPGADDAPPIVFDMASSATAFGKLMQAKAAGLPIPDGWALDAQGLPTIDASQAKTLLPVGGPKGSGLALMAEMVCSLLCHNPILAPALAQPHGQHRHQQNAMLVAIDIAQLTDLRSFCAEVAALVAAIKQLPSTPGAHILMPGERGSHEAQQRAQQGIPLAPATVQALDKLATQWGLATPWSGA